MRTIRESILTRRTLIQRGLIAGAGIALAGREILAADSASNLPLITKQIPSTGERLPVIGLGTNAFSVSAADELAARKEVLQHFPQLGARVVDTARGYGEAEVVIGKLVTELGIRDQLFLATKTTNRGEPKPGDGELEEALARLQTNRIDLLQVHNFNGIDQLFPRLKEWKQGGKIRYIGVTTSTDEQYPQMLNALKTLPLDFIQVDYSIENRGAGDEILPLAKDKGVAVLGNVPLGGRRGSLLSKVSAKPLPPWASEIDVTSWPQLLLKYNVSHPAITAVIPGTTKLSHLQDNQQAGRGRLPDAAMRKRIEQYWETI